MRDWCFKNTITCTHIRPCTVTNCDVHADVSCVYSTCTYTRIKHTRSLHTSRTRCWPITLQHEILLLAGQPTSGQTVSSLRQGVTAELTVKTARRAAHTSAGCVDVQQLDSPACCVTIVSRSYLRHTNVLLTPIIKLHQQIKQNMRVRVCAMSPGGVCRANTGHAGSRAVRQLLFVAVLTNQQLSKQRSRMAY